MSHVGSRAGTMHARKKAILFLTIDAYRSAPVRAGHTAPRRTCCVFTAPPDACGFSAIAKRWPGEPTKRSAPRRACCVFTIPPGARSFSAIARRWPGEPQKNGRRPAAPAVCLLSRRTQVASSIEKGVKTVKTVKTVVKTD